MKALLLILGVLVAAWLGVHALFGHSERPSEADVMRGADKAFAGEYCHVTATKEIRWPCVKVASFDFIRSASDLEHAAGSGDEYKVCFDLHMEYETTAWNAIQEIPAEPRTFAEAPAPKRFCGLAAKFVNDSEWSVIPNGNEQWWKPDTEQLWQAMCARGPCGD